METAGHRQGQRWAGGQRYGGFAGDSRQALRVEYEARTREDYAIALQVVVSGEWRTVRLFDNAHGTHEMHDYTGSEKQPAESVARASSEEAVAAAITELVEDWESIVESWRR